jgi:hypothetical protein
MALSACERLMYFPQPLTVRAAERVRARHPAVEEIHLRADDGTRLHGWLLAQAGTDPRGRVVYFGGNAEEVSWMLDFADAFAGWDLVLVNYRGYGLSEGEPGEAALFADALAVHDHVTGAGRVPVVALGRSLGSAVAVYLASQRPLRGVLLVAPFDTAAAVARDAFPFLPGRLLLGDVYDSLARAPGITTPLAVVIAGEDEVVAPARSHRLADAWAGPREVATVPGAGHNDLQGHAAYWRAIRGFLARWSAQPGPP